MEEKSFSGSHNSSDSENSTPPPVKFSLHLSNKPSVKPKSDEEPQENVQHITEFDYKPLPRKVIPSLSNSWRLSMVSQSFELPTQILQDHSVISEEGLSKEELEKRKLRKDIKMCAEEASLEAYERIPVEEFGEALLRGMGWSHGKAVGLNSRDPVLPFQNPNRRVARLGLGAFLPVNSITK